MSIEYRRSVEVVKGILEGDDFRSGLSAVTKPPIPGLPNGEPFGVPAFAGMTNKRGRGILEASQEWWAAAHWVLSTKDGKIRLRAW